LESLCSLYRLIKPYWSSEEKYSAWALSVAIIALNIAMVYIGVLLNWWRKDLFDALQILDSHAFYHQLGVFSVLALLWVLTSTYRTYFKQVLHIRWRRWMTEQYLNKWLENKVYYEDFMDNPDQRIAEDLDRFTDETLTLSLGFLNAAMTLVSFSGLLWMISPYMLLFALFYAVIGTWVTHRIGHLLVGLNFDKQRYEADFRFGLVCLREKNILKPRFIFIFDNFLTIIKRTKLLSLWTYSYSQAAIVFPYLIMAPRFFSRDIQLGDLMQTASAFSTVETSLSYVMNSYASIASWQSVAERLLDFEQKNN